MPTMNSYKPRVSIGIPVYNGENYLSEALDSLLAQTFTDFELIIADNASTDRTEEICRAYVAKDPRIRYFRNEKNLGAAPNYNRVFELSSGEYFKWAAHDDVCSPDFLSNCVKVLDEDSSIVLCYPKTKIINEHGDFVKLYEPKPRLNTDSQKPQERFRDLITVEHGCYQVFGLIRSSALKTTPLVGPYAASDQVLLAELSLHGRFYEIPEYLFWRRFHSQTSGNVNRDRREWTYWFDPTTKDRIIFPHWRIYFEIFRSIRRVPLSLVERISCYLPVVRMEGWLREFWKWMGFELIRGTYEMLKYHFLGLKKN